MGVEGLLFPIGMLFVPELACGTGLIYSAGGLPDLDLGCLNL